MSKYRFVKKIKISEKYIERTINTTFLVLDKRIKPIETQWLVETHIYLRNIYTLTS